MPSISAPTRGPRRPIPRLAAVPKAAVPDLVPEEPEIIVRPATPVSLSYPDAAARFVAWVRAMGLAGVYSDKQLTGDTADMSPDEARRIGDGLIAWWAHEEHVVPPNAVLLLTQIKRQLGVHVDRPRYKPEAETGARERRYRPELHQPEGKERWTRYVIQEAVHPVVLASFARGPAWTRPDDRSGAVAEADRIAA